MAIPVLMANIEYTENQNYDFTMILHVSSLMFLISNLIR